MENVNINVFNMITRTNVSKTFTKRILCKFKCKFDGRKCNLNQNWNNKCRYKCKNLRKHHVC